VRVSGITRCCGSVSPSWSHSTIAASYAAVRANASSANARRVVSVETYEPDVVRACLDAGARILNMTGREHEDEMLALAAEYDAAVVRWLQGDDPLPRHVVLPLERTDEQLRYGENPHQQAARYRISGTSSWWDHVEQHAGLALSYLNLYDADAAWKLVHDLGNQPAVAIIKHANPCGVAVAGDLAGSLAEVYQRALECDERSAFGGIVALNHEVDAATAERMVAGPQADLIMAPSWAPGTIDALIAKRKNTRLLTAGPPEPQNLDFRQISGGFLVQDAHHFAATRSDWRVVTKRAPTDAEWRDAELAWRICGHVKSNAIVLVKGGQAVGIGAGQQNRVESGEIAALGSGRRALGDHLQLGFADHAAVAVLN
jgi:phosphoribosylaminoimidazolecarboxamide formyltransferase/IMP cyclohydrolase